MNLYDKASLIITPNAYKAGKIYAAKPTSGAGDLTFARAGSRWRIGPNGLVEAVAANTPAISYLRGSCPSIELLPQYTNDWTNNNYLTGYTSGTNAVRDDSLTLDAFGSGFHGLGYTFTDGQSFQGPYLVRAFFNTTGLPVQRGAIMIKNPSHDFFGFNITGMLSSAIRIRFSTLESSNPAESRVFKIADNTYVVYFFNNAAPTVSFSQIRISPVVSLASSVTVSGTAILGLGYFRAQASGFLPNVYAPVVTGDTSVTVTGDASTTTGLSSLLGQASGTIAFDFVYRNTLGGRGQLGISRSGSATNRIALWNNVPNAFAFQVAASGVIAVNNTNIGPAVEGTRYRIAIGFESGDTVVYINGVQVLTSSATFAFNEVLDTLILGSYDAVIPPNQELNLVYAATSRLSNAELAALTTI